MTASVEPKGREETAARMPRLSRGLAVDLVIAVILMAGSGVWAARFWQAWMAQGGQPVYYQLYFEPAVMVACGKGFAVIDSERPQALDDFLNLRRDRIECADLPHDAQVGRQKLFQGALRYLLTTVGWAWWLLGISWTGMGPFFGLLFGTVIALSYGIFRLGIGRPAALACALAFAISAGHLTNLPHLRDYAKAPFTLALVLLLGLMVTLPLRRGVLLALAAAYGAVVGVGYGFRSDFLVNVPVFVFVVFAFLEGSLLKNLLLKLSASLVFIAAFLLVSWPVTSTVYAKGGCQWHVALLGLQSPFDSGLRIAPAPYDFGYAYSDAYLEQTITGYAHRMEPASTTMGFCSHEYDVQSGNYLVTIVSAFPADIIARAYGSVLQIMELPFVRLLKPLEGWATGLYEARREFLQPKVGWGLYFGCAALLMVGARSLRLAAFLLFFVAYFGGYPAIQFHDRHHFHLEFMSWWAIGFVIHHTVTSAIGLWRSRPERKQVTAGVAQSAAFAAAAVALVVLPLLGARWYQQRQATNLFASYIDAPKAVLPSSGAVPGDVPPWSWPQLIEVDLNLAQCGRDPAVTFRYEPDAPGGDLSRVVTVERRPTVDGVTRIYQPVFRHYRGLEYSDARPGCVVGAARLADQQGFPMLFSATLPPNWQNAALHQRLADLEFDPALPPFADLPEIAQWSMPQGRPAPMNLLGWRRYVGDHSTSGYQLTSPRVDAPANARVHVRTNLSVQSGDVCLGALNATASAWLSPASETRRGMTFTVDASGGFIVAIANCNPVDTGQPTRFSLSWATYAID